MIGLPTNFQHCAHIGCSDLSPGSNSNSASNNAIDLTANGLISQHRINVSRNI